MAESSTGRTSRRAFEKVRGRVQVIRGWAEQTLLWRIWDRMLETEFVDRSIALAGKAFVSFFPLLIVIAAFVPARLRMSIFTTVTNRLGITGASLATVRQAFASAEDIRRATGLLGLVLAVFFASSFTTALRRAYLRAWRRPPGGKAAGNYVRGVAWVAAFLVYMALLGGARTVLGGGAGIAPFVVVALALSARARGAEQVVRHGRDRQPGRVRGEDPGEHVSERAAGDVGEDLLRDRVVAVLPLGLHQPGRRVGEHCVVTPGGEQLVHPLGGLLVLVADPADDQPGSDGPALLRRERRVLSFGDLGVGDPAVQLVVPDRLRVPYRCSALFGDGGDGGADAGVHGNGDGEPRAAAADRASEAVRVLAELLADIPFTLDWHVPTGKTVTNSSCWSRRR